MALERIAGFDIHPAASLFPLMTEHELDELSRDISERGQDQPILLYEGKVLDGRNRLMACEKAGIQPRTADWDCRGGSPAAFVLSANVRRRHLSESQRAMIAAELLPLFEKEAHARRVATLKKGDKKPESAPVREREKAADRAAAAAAVSTRYVEAAKAVAQKDPELAEKVKAGAVTLKRAEKEIRKNEAVRAVKAYVAPEGSYNVIAADPPWPFEDELDGSDEARGGLPYPSMSLEDICALKVPADTDCVLFLWTTNTHLADGSCAQVLKAWGFKPKTILTWDKQRMGTGRYLRNITEHCVVATKGSPVVTLTTQTTLLAEPKRQHSRKPEGFYRLVESLCPSTNRIELFARAPREGWVTDGAEKELFGTELEKGLARLADRADAQARGVMVDEPLDDHPIVALSHSSFLAGKDVCCGCGADAETMKFPNGPGYVKGGVKDGRFGLPFCGNCEDAGNPRAYIDEADWLAGMQARQQPLPLGMERPTDANGNPICKGYPPGRCKNPCGGELCYDCAQKESRDRRKAEREKRAKRERTEEDPNSEGRYREARNRVGCPDCRAKPGENCVTASGVARVSHATRLEALKKLERSGGEVMALSEFRRRAKKLGFTVVKGMLGAVLASCTCGHELRFDLTSTGDIDPRGLEPFEEHCREHHATPSEHAALPKLPKGFEWKLSAARVQKAHVVIDDARDVGLCGATLPSFPPRKATADDRLCSTCRLKAEARS